MTHALVIGAGIGGLTAAAMLAQAGYKVTVLESHVYPGGCAGTFYHQGYRFDAGATLAGGFYEQGPMDLVARAVGISAWPGHPSAPAMQVHLPGRPPVNRWGDERRWEEYAQAFGKESLRFWRWQENTADALWDLALRSPAWPPQTLNDVLDLTGKGLGWLSDGSLQRIMNLPYLAMDAFRPAAIHLRNLPEDLRLFVDAQLLISAQTTSDTAYALYAASALDLPRRGVLHLEGGMGAIASLLTQAVRSHGGQVLFRQKVEKIEFTGAKARAVKTNKGDVFEADLFIANLPPWNIARLAGQDSPVHFNNLPANPPGNWGAFMVYVGLDASLIPPDFPLHHQLILRRPLGEGNTLFLSLSPEWDTRRAPTGKRALTMSTHTDLSTWWQLHRSDPKEYAARRDQFAQNLLAAAEHILPGLRQAAHLVLPGTPLTFQRFTSRQLGWVGGFQQTSLFQARAPRLGPNLWMVGDSIFPGQSVAATALGGLRVAGAILQHRESSDRRAPIPEEATL